MARFDRDLGLIRYDFEDGGFGMDGPFQEEFLTNIIRPPQPFVQATPQPAAPQIDPVAALFASQEPAAAEVDYFAQQFTPDIFTPTQPVAQPIAQPVAEAAPAYEPFRGLNNIIVEEPLEKFVQDITEPPPTLTQPAAQPIAQPVTEPASVYAPFNSSSGIIEDVEEPLERFVQDVTEPTPLAPVPTPQPTQPEQPAKPAGPAPEVLGSLTKQILGSSDTSKWSGAGYGSAEKNAEDMAKILAGIGITDIKQFGPITRQVQKIQGYEETGEPIYQTVTEQTYGNKETGQAVPNTYTERQTGNFFGGTYEGKGNTGYGVQFDAQGNPIFYTQGASSSDIGKIAPLLTLASFVPGLQPFAMAANAAIAAKQGNPLGVITNLAGMGGLAGVSGMADVANAARFAGAVQSGDPLAMLFSGANLAGVSDIGGINLRDVSKTIGGIKAIQSGDPLTMMLYGMDAMSGSGGSSLTKSSADLQTEDPLSPEEQTQLIENRLNSAISRSQISPDEEDANTQRAIEDLERMYGPSSATRSFTPEPQVDEADDFLKSIGINTLDKPSDSGLSNQDILNLINADNEVLVTSNRDTVGKGVSEDILRNLEDAGEPPSLTPAEKLSELVMTTGRDTVGKGVSEDIFRNLEDAGEPPSLTPAEKLSELVIKGDRPKEEMTVQQEPANIEEFIKSLEPYKAPITDLERLVITGNRDTVGKGVSEDIFRNLEDAGEPLLPLPVADSNRVEIVGNRPPAYLPTDNDFPATPIKNPEISDLERLIITGNKEPSYLPTDDDFMPTPIDDGGELKIIGNRPPTTSTPAPTTPVPTTPGATPAPKAPAKTPTTRAPASRSSNMDLLGLLALLSGQQAPVQQAPMQDPYAHIKLMEDLFGSTIDLTPAGDRAA
jgi:hypothetical protein